MKHETKHTVKVNIVNMLGSFGYLFGFMQWFWAVILYISVIQAIAKFFSSSNNRVVEPSSGLNFSLSGPIATIMLGIIVVTMVVLTVYVLVSLPKNIVKTSNKVVHKTAKTIAPVALRAQHKHNTKKARIKITTQLVFVLKSLLILIPFLLTIGSTLLETQSINYSIALIIGCVLATSSLILFATQYVLAKLLGVNYSYVW